MEILESTTEPERVLAISRIVNHPRYQPNRVTHVTRSRVRHRSVCIQEGLGQGGPIEGYDVAVYHVVTDHTLGGDTRDNIWPVCLPKNDGEYEARGLSDGFIAGWLDTPPPSQLDPLQLGFESNSFEGVRRVRK